MREETSIELGVEGYIPSEYVEDELMKLTMYKKIASIREEVDAEEVIDELIDRFGDIPKGNDESARRCPDPRSSQGKRISQRCIREKNKLVFYFNMKKGPDPERLSAAVAEYGMNLLLHGGQRPYIKLNPQKSDSMEECILFLTKLIR